MSTALTITTNTQTNRVYLNINRESIWITRPNEKQIEMLRSKNLDDVQVVRYKSETRMLYYLKCEDYSSLITAPQAVKILALQNRISAQELVNLKKPADIDKLVNLRTVQQVPYWIEDIENKDVSTSYKKVFWYCVKFKEHYISKFASRAQAQRVIKALNELGEPCFDEGVLRFQASTFSMKTLNWYNVNPCREFVLYFSGTLPRTQFENSCTALIPYTSLLPVPKTTEASTPPKASKRAKSAASDKVKPPRKASRTAQSKASKDSKPASIKKSPKKAAAPKEAVKAAKTKTVKVA